MINYFNQSILGMASKCMKQVEFRYVKGIRIPPSAGAHRGTALHKAAQADAEIIKEKNIHLNSSDLSDLAATAFHESVEKDGVYFSSEEAPNSNAVLSSAKDDAVRAAVLYGEEVSPKIETPIHIEQELTLEIEGLNYQLGGRIDLIHLVNGSNKISDLKTTAKKPDTEIVGLHGIQAPMYSMLAENLLGQQPDFDFEYLVLQKTKQENITIPAIVDQQARQNVLDRARVLDRYLQTGVFMPADPTSWVCSEAWCGFWGICPHGQRQQKSISVK